MWKIEKSFTFPAAHFLYGIEGVDAEIHGHNFVVGVVLSGDVLVRSGVVVESRDIDRMFRNVVGVFCHSLINRIQPFDVVSQTLENLSRYVFEGFCECVKSLPSIVVSAVSVDDGNTKVTYFG